MRFARSYLSLITVLAVFFWANHCVLTNAFAASSKQHNSSRSNTASPCCGEENNGSSPPWGHHHSDDHHSNCDNSGCCQPALKASYGAVQDAPLLLIDLPAMLATHLESYFKQKSTALRLATPTSPNKLLRMFTTLTAAPNAPPA